MGDLALQIPKLRVGSFLPTILEPRRRVDQVLYAVIMEALPGVNYLGGGGAPAYLIVAGQAYICELSTRKVDALVVALGSQSCISKSQVSLICQEIDQQVQGFLARPLESSDYA